MPGIFSSGSSSSINLRDAGDPYNRAATKMAPCTPSSRTDSDSCCDFKNSRNVSENKFSANDVFLRNNARNINDNIRDIFDNLHNFSNDFFESIYDINEFLEYLQQVSGIERDESDPIDENERERGKFKFPQDRRLEACVRDIGLSISQKMYYQGLSLGSCDPCFLNEIEKYEEENNIFSDYFYYGEILKDEYLDVQLKYYIGIAKNDAEVLTRIKNIFFEEIDRNQAEFESEFFPKPISSTINIMVEAIFGFCLAMGGFIALMNPIISSAISITLCLSGVLLFLLRIRSGIRVFIFKRDKHKKELAGKEFEKIRMRATKIFKNFSLSKKPLKDLEQRIEKCLQDLTVDQLSRKADQLSEKLDQLSEKLNRLIDNNQSAREYAHAHVHPILQSPVYLEQTQRAVPAYLQPHYQAEQFMHSRQTQARAPAHSQPTYREALPNQQYECEGEPFHRQFVPSEQTQARAPAHSQPTYREALPNQQYGYEGEQFYRQFAPSEQTQAEAETNLSNTQHLTQSGEQGMQRGDQSGSFNRQQADQSGLFDWQHVHQRGAFNIQHVRQPASFGTQYVSQGGRGNRQYVSQIDSLSQQYMDQSGVNRAHQAYQAKLNNAQPMNETNLVGLTAPAELPRPPSQLEKLSPPPTPRVEASNIHNSRFNVA